MGTPLIQRSVSASNTTGYIRDLSIGDASFRGDAPFSANSHVKAEPADHTECSICGRPPSQSKVTVTCEPCVKFFRRNCFSVETPICHLGGSCSVRFDRHRNCLACRLTKCRAAGLVADETAHKRRKTGMEINFQEMPCKICGASSTGYHFGAITCEACKGFFRRSALKETYRSYNCVGTGDCLITPLVKKCSSCRYKKCAEVNMALDSAKVGRRSLQAQKQVVAEYQRLTSSRELLSAPVFARKKTAKRSFSSLPDSEGLGEVELPESEDEGDAVEQDLTPYSCDASPLPSGHPLPTTYSELSFASPSYLTLTPATDTPGTTLANWQRQLFDMFDSGQLLSNSEIINLDYKATEGHLSHLEPLVRDHLLAIVDQLPCLNQLLLLNSHDDLFISVRNDHQLFPTYAWGVLQRHVKRISQVMAEFCKHLPGFSMINMAHRLKLFRQGLFPLIQSHYAMAGYRRNGTHFWITADLYNFTLKLFPEMAQWFECRAQLGGVFEAASWDVIEYACFIVRLIVVEQDLEGAALTQLDIIEQAHNSYLQVKYGQSAAVGKMQFVMQLLNEVRSYEKMHEAVVTAILHRLNLIVDPFYKEVYPVYKTHLPGTSDNRDGTADTAHMSS